VEISCSITACIQKKLKIFQFFTAMGKSMTKLIFIFALMLSIVAIFTFLADDYQSFAQSGCCKQRRSSEGRWYETDLSYEQCSELNSKKDGDNVNKPYGLVWWDEHC
jgi:hypothetical protein